MAAASGTTCEARIYIVRKGHGGAYAVPSPAVFIVPGDGPVQLAFRNLTECPASVYFPKEAKDPLDLGAGAGGRLDVKPEDIGRYVEYRIQLHCGERGEQYVEGGSQPGVIIDR